MNEVRVVTSAVYVSDHILRITFDDSVSAEIDFSPWIQKFPIFKPLADIEIFKSFSLDGWTVVWENGADVAPEKLYEIALAQSKLIAA